MIEYVEIAHAREATAVRMAVTPLLPSPWSEAAKGVFRIAGVPVLAVRKTRENTAEIDAWVGADNVPAVLYGSEPVRTHWSAIVSLAARLGRGVLPSDLAARGDAMGLLELLAGEDGLGWNARLQMIHAALTAGRGFPAPVAGYLARRYGYVADAMPEVHQRVAAQLQLLDARLAARHAQGHAYLGGEHVSAPDVYLATFLTPLFPVTAEVCPQITASLREAFAQAADAFGPWVSPALAAHRARVFEQHLVMPIPL